MFYENELRFLCEILKKCRVSVNFASPDDFISKVIDENFKIIFETQDYDSKKISEITGDLKPYNIYKFTNQYKLHYLFLVLPQTTNPTLMLIGPYLKNKIDNRQILEIAERNSITPTKQKLLRDYYNSIPYLSESDRLFTLIDTFAERIWGGVGSYGIVDATSEFVLGPQLLFKTNSDSNNDVIANMKFMEQRYAYENEIMMAVSSGNDHKVSNFISTITEYNFDSRTPDVLRNYKNYAVVMNTLLRKAVENGGVHPVYIDELSTNFAIKIEQGSSIETVQEIMRDMFKSYCRLVRKHSTKKYSSTVQKTIALIEYDLSANLTLSTLAKTQNISSGYLSTIFKKETGKTLTEYIIEKRIDYAMRLLSTTRLQVQTVALHCGIMDVQYFSKIFKKKTGKTPKEFRETVKTNNYV